MKSTTKQADDQSDKPLTQKYVGKRMSKRQYAQVLASLTSPHARGAWRRLYFDRQRQDGGRTSVQDRAGSLTVPK